MLLRFIEQSSANAIQISFQTEDQTITFTIDDFSSPISAEFYRNLTWYFQYYLQPSNQPVDDRNVGDGLLLKGLGLGDSLLGEDFELMKVSDMIETKGHSNISVWLESSRIEFFQTFWELLVLSDAKYVLSAVCQEFVRRFNGPDQSDYENEVAYELHGDTAADANDAEPLGVLHIIAHGVDGKRPINAFNASVHSLCWASAIDYMLCLDKTLETFQERLSDSARPVHCVHYDGPICFLGGMPHIFPSEQGCEPLALDVFCRLLAKHKVALLSIDACSYLDEDHGLIDFPLGLATVARVAAAAGLTNVVGLSYQTDPWTASNCFEHLYDKLLLGLSIGQAVVETRKQLQTQLETKRFRVEGLPFHAWPLPVHYGGQAVRFFEQSQQAVELMQSPAYQHTHQRLFGFHSHYLPPEVDHCEDQNLLALLNAAHTGEVHVHRLFGSSGSGKTHLVHQAGFYWAQQQRIDYGFYFDVSTGFYSCSDIRQMIAPVFDCEAGDSEKLDAALREHRCCFVFDNLDASTLSQWPEASEAALTELREYLIQLAQQQHIVVVAGREDQALTDALLMRVEPLLPLSQQVFAASSLRKELGDISGDDWLSLLECLQGNPFLIQKVMPQLANHTCAELVDTINAWPDEAQCDPVARYYRWQWGRLEEPWQQLLRLIADLPAVPLEMLTLACRQVAEPVDIKTEAIGSNSPEKPNQNWSEPAIRLFKQLSIPIEDESSGFHAAQDRLATCRTSVETALRHDC